MPEIDSFGEHYARLLMADNATEAWELIVARDEAQREAGRREIRITSILGLPAVVVAEGAGDFAAAFEVIAHSDLDEIPYA